MEKASSGVTGPVERYHPQMPLSTRFALRDKIEQGFRIEIGDYTYGVPSVHWNPMQRRTYGLTIGKFCSIALEVSVYVGTQGRHPTEFLTTYPIGMIFGPVSERSTPASHGGDLSVRIGSDVWIGRGALIQAGVTIGDGAVIGSRALVTRDIPPYAVAYGAPAKPLRFRFSDIQIARLLDLKWWDLPTETLKENVSLLQINDVDRAIAGLEALRAGRSTAN